MDRWIKAIRAGQIYNAYLVTGSDLAEVERQGMALAKAISPYPMVLSDTKMENIREMLEQVSIRPDEGQKKAVVLYLDEMSERSQNAILKTLEEPPAYGSFILLCVNLTVPLPTILSRCVLVHVPRQKDAAIEAELKKRQVVSYKLCARYAFGSLERAAYLSENPEFFRRRETALGYLTGFLSRRVMTVNKEEKEQVSDYLFFLLLFFRDCALPREPYFYFDQPQLVKSFQKRFTFSQIISMMKVIQGMDILLHKRTNPHLVWDRAQLGLLEVLDGNSDRSAV